MTEQAETEQVILGKQRYAVERFWGEWPDEQRRGVLSTLAVDSTGAVYIARRGAPPVIVFEPDGSCRGSWPSDGVTDPHGIRIDSQDRVLLVDRDAHEVQIRTTDGTPITTLGARNRPQFQAPFNHPTSAFATDDGEIYVSDGYGNSAVHRFAADGRHISTWGQPGTGPGEFSTPHAVWVDQQNRVLVADRENDRICVFDRSGNHLADWTGFYHPMDVTTDSSGAIYVSDQVPRITQLASDGQITGRARPVWNVPHGMACSPNGMMFFIEMNPTSITALRPIDAH